jgi:hypothetical protein
MYETITVEEAQAQLAELITGLTDIYLKILPSTCHENTPGQIHFPLVCASGNPSLAIAYCRHSLVDCHLLWD